MGYYTSYILSVVNQDNFTKDQLKEASKKLAHRLGEDEYEEFSDRQNIDDVFEWIGYDTRKWYEHEEDMTQLSLEYPDMIFLLEGWGEELDDVWRKYFKDGKMEVCGRNYYWDDAPEWARG